MAVSQEELVIHDCQVVCPQCLAVCSYENGKLVVLPSGIHFCPYCGADLKAPFDEAQPDPQPAPEPTPEPEPVSKVEPVVEEKHEKPAQRRHTSSQVEDKLRTMPHRYNSMHPRLQQHGEMPSTTFKIVAYALIVLLLIVLVWIIVAGANIESPV